MKPAMTFRLALCSAIAASLAPTIALAQPAADAVQGKDTVRFDIPSQPMATALQAFADQAGMQLLYRADAVSRLTAPGLSGEFDRPTALRRLLAGTDLEVVYSSPLIATIRAREVSPTSGQKTGAIEGVAPPTGQADRERGEEPPVGKDSPAAMESIVVTGSRIRGGTSPSPVITIGAETIREEGFTDLGEVARSIPQNFRGGQNPGVVPGATAGAGGMANQNVSGGSALNLRGLGPDASLTLLNGRRMSYGSFVQSVDISAIPIEAVERVEIVADGASAIYGSDAVGGVGNVILFRDYDGIAASARYGAATEGGLATREFNLTGGTTWSSGGFIATAKKVDSNALFARQRDYTAYMFDPTTLYPESDLRSGLVSMHQSLGELVELKLDALKTERRQILFPFNTGLTPYFETINTKTSTTLMSPSLDISLPNDWLMQVGASSGRDRVDYRQFETDIASGARRVWNNQCFCNSTKAYEIGIEGPLFALPGGEVRLAAGGGFRKNEFSQRNHLTSVTGVEGGEGSRFAYAELNLPIVGSDSGFRGFHRLELNLAARSEDYDSFGGVTTPKLGLIYSPSDDVTLKGSWGKSFKAPTLFQRYMANSVQLDDPSYYGGVGYPASATVIALAGGDRNLGPERAETWSTSLAFHPKEIPGLQAEVTWFDIDYTDRVVEPIANFGRALGNPMYDEFISYNPSIEELERALASGRFYNWTGSPYDPNSVVAILYARYANVARQKIKGLDVSTSYRFELGPGQLTLRGTGSWLDSSQQASKSSPWHDISGSLFNPAKVNGRFGAVWVQGGLTASVFGNYIGGVTNKPVQGPVEKTSSFVTMDATLRYDFDDATRWSGTSVAFNAQNFLNRAPPYYAPTGHANPPYDSTNYSSIGRFLSLTVSKSF